MSTPSPIAQPATANLRARLHRLAADPRVRLVPELRGLTGDLVRLCDQIDELGWRLAGLEQAIEPEDNKLEFHVSPGGTD